MVKINLGCGYRKIPDFINIDNRAEVKPDLVCDCMELPYETSTVDVVVAQDYLEHIPTGKTVDQITEIWRVLKHGGKLLHVTPSPDGRGAFQDPTHKSVWNINSWFSYMDDEYRNQCGIDAKFEGVNVDLWTDGKVCHTHGHLIAVKEVK